MKAKTTELHGISPKVTRLGIARHEAAHLVMLWLLDHPALFCMVDDNGGATKQLKAPDAHKETILEHVLDSLAGMIGEWAPEVIAELKEHIRDINWFFGESDSHHIALGISYLDGDPEVWLCGFIEVTHRLLVKFSRPHREVTKLLLQKDVLDAVMIYNLFEKWDAMYFQGDDRPKSDLVVRCFLRVFGRRASRKVFYGWDLKPLPPDWKPQPKLTFEDWLKIACKKPRKKPAKDANPNTSASPR